MPNDRLAPRLWAGGPCKQLGNYRAGLFFGHVAPKRLLDAGFTGNQPSTSRRGPFL